MIAASASAVATSMRSTGSAWCGGGAGSLPRLAPRVISQAVMAECMVKRARL
jgi:hypothetical protein